jgi:hypothetical protein
MTDDVHSTDDIDPGKFRPHGRVDYEVKGSILWTRAEGPFNSELIGALAKLIFEVLPVMAAKGTWANIAVFRHSAMGSFEVLANFTDMLKQAVDAKFVPVGVAFVLPPDVEGANLMGPRYARCYAEAGIRFESFPDVELAKQWVDSMMREADNY